MLSFQEDLWKSHNGSICKFGEQVHYKLSGHPSSRVEPRWELGAWVGKTELTDEHLLGTLSLESGTAERSIGCRRVTATAKNAWDRIVGTPTNLKPDGAAKDPQIRRQYITQRWVDEHGVTPGCPRCEGRGTMTHSETCRKRFEEIEKKKIDKRLEEEAARIPEPPPETVNEMDVEQPQEQPMTGGASSSSGPVVPVQEAAPVASPSSHEVRMDESSGSTRPLEVDGGESSNKRARSLAGMLLFDENDTSDWQDTIWEAQLTDAHDEHDRQEILMDQRAQSDTDVPGVWRCQIEPKSDLYGDKTGKLLDPEKVIKGRLTELKHMNDHHVYDWIDEAEIPKGTKVETSRWLDDLKPRDGDENSVRSRTVVQQYNVYKRLDVHQGTPPLKVLRMLLALATSKDSHRRKVSGIWDVSVAFFHSPMDEFTVVRPPVGLRVRGKLWVLKRALYGTRMASRCFGRLVGEVLKDAQFEAVTIVPNTYHHPQRDIDTVVHGDDFVAVAEDDHLNFLERVLENSMEIKRVGRIGPGRSSTGKVLKRVVSWTGDGFTWEADPRLSGKLLKLLNLTEGKGASVPGAKDIGKDDRDVNSELEYAEAKIVQAAAGLEQYIALDRPDIA